MFKVIRDLLLEANMFAYHYLEEEKEKKEVKDQDPS